MGSSISLAQAQRSLRCPSGVTVTVEIAGFGLGRGCVGEVFRDFEQQPIGVAKLTGAAVIRAFAEAVLPEIEAAAERAEKESRKRNAPKDLAGVDACLIRLYRPCLRGDFKEGTLRSQRDLFSTFLIAMQ